MTGKQKPNDAFAKATRKVQCFWSCSNLGHLRPAPRTVLGCFDFLLGRLRHHFRKGLRDLKRQLPCNDVQVPDVDKEPEAPEDCFPPKNMTPRGQEVSLCYWDRWLLCRKLVVAVSSAQLLNSKWRGGGSHGSS